MSSQSMTESPEYLSLADKVGSFIEYWGFKQVHGKIWTLIFLSPQPVDANFLKDTLKISKALTSMSLKDLLLYNVIQEVIKEKPGTQKYTINPNITEVILEIINKRELVMLQKLQQDSQKLEQKVSKNPDGDIDPKRMGQLCDMINAATVLLSGMTAGSHVDFQLFNQVMTIQD